MFSLVSSSRNIHTLCDSVCVHKLATERERHAVVQSGKGCVAPKQKPHSHGPCDCTFPNSSGIQSGLHRQTAGVGISNAPPSNPAPIRAPAPHSCPCPHWCPCPPHSCTCPHSCPCPLLHQGAPIPAPFPSPALAKGAGRREAATLHSRRAGPRHTQAWCYHHRAPRRMCT